MEALAGRLSKRAIFRSVSANSMRSPKDYSIFLGVPAHCLTLRNTKVNIGKDFPYHVIDLLICRGREAVLAIVLDAQYSGVDKLFDRHLQMVPHEFLKSGDLTDETADDFCDEIESRLRRDRSNPGHTGILLHSIRLSYAVSKMNEPVLTAKMRSGSRRFLEKKHLIRSSGSVTGYGHACGMFRRIPAGGRRSVYVTVHQASVRLKQAMLWRDEAEGDSALASRIARISRGLPSTSAMQQAEILRKLLQTPLEEFFQNYPDDGHRLNVLLSHAQFLSRESDVSAFGDREDIKTYGDVIYAVKNLWEYTAREDGRNSDAACTCEQLLACLSLPIWSQSTDDTWKKRLSEQNAAGARSLQTQMSQLRSEVYDFSLGIMPLPHYFYAAACLTESEYPLWLYSTCVQPWITLYSAEELCFARTMQVVYDLYQSDDELKAADVLPLLYDILVEPVSEIV